MMTHAYDRDAVLAALTRALPYVRLYRGRTFVVKFGGELSADADALRRAVLQVGTLCEFGIRVVVVHGGGPQATALAEKLGVAGRIVEGRRVTSPATLDAVVMAVNGAVNTAVLAACRAAGLPAIGISGIDAGLVRAAHRPPVEVAGESVDFGEVGDVTGVDGSVCERLLGAGFVPVVSPLAADESGRVLNVNADTVAARIAAELAAEKLIFLTDAPGILEDRRDANSLVSYVDLAGLADLERRGALAGGMLPKVGAVRAALSGGVSRVHIVGHRSANALLAEVFTNEGAGTLIVRDTAELAPAEQAAP
jgi:acetylglutamate kinase